MKKNIKHWFRGFVSLVLLGSFLVVCALNLLILFIRNFFSGLNPFNWYSDSAGDWLFGYGMAGGAGMYFGFMINGIIAYGCLYGISWAFTGKGVEL